MATDSPMIDQPNVVKPLFELSGKLLIQMNALNQAGNVIMSPVSIHQALSMVLLGSDNNSETKREILDTIGYSNMSEDEIERCHQDYAKVMSDFARVSERTRRGRREDKQKGEEGV
jgi:serine protease inhibitor